MQKFMILVLMVAHQVTAHGAEPDWIEPSYSIVQGTTSESITHFTVMAHQDDPISFKAFADGSDIGVAPEKMERITYPGSEYVVHRLRFTGLQLKNHYKLKIFNTKHQILEIRGFRMLDPQQKMGKVALASCMVRQLHNPFMWKALQREKPDLMLFLGDSVYLDRASVWSRTRPSRMSDVWESFVASRKRLQVYFWEELTPIISVWDDHDAGDDNVEPDYPLMPYIRNVYDAFFANDAIAGVVAHGPGLAKQFKIFGTNFLFLDPRSFRGLEPRSPMFGEKQERWLFENLKAGPNLLINGSQFFGASLKKDSYEFNWPEKFLEFNDKLQAASDAINSTIAFASGDIHFSELQQIEPSVLGYSSVEITSSSVHSFTIPGAHHLFKPANSRRLAAVSTHNALVLDFSQWGPGLQFQVRAVGWRGTNLFTVPVNVQRPCAGVLDPKT